MVSWEAIAFEDHEYWCNKVLLAQNERVMNEPDFGSFL